MRNVRCFVLNVQGSRKFHSSVELYKSGKRVPNCFFCYQPNNCRVVLRFTTKFQVCGLEYFTRETVVIFSDLSITMRNDNTFKCFFFNKFLIILKRLFYIRKCFYAQFFPIERSRKSAIKRKYIRIYTQRAPFQSHFSLSVSHLGHSLRLSLARARSEITSSQKTFFPSTTRAILRGISQRSGDSTRRRAFKRTHFHAAASRMRAARQL